MKTLWHIRPINDGYTVIGERYTDKGKKEFYTINKADKNSYCYCLMFLSQEDADNFIKENMNPNEYISEWILINEDYLCPTCGFPLIVEWYSELSNGNTEDVCHCTNEDCGADWTITRDENYSVINKERFFFG